MPPSRTETWVVKLIGGPEDGAEVRMNDMFCDIYLTAPPPRKTLMEPVDFCEKEKFYKHVYKRVSTYRAEYVGVDLHPVTS